MNRIGEFGCYSLKDVDRLILLSITPGSSTLREQMAHRFSVHSIFLKTVRPSADKSAKLWRFLCLTTPNTAMLTSSNFWQRRQATWGLVLHAIAKQRDILVWERLTVCNTGGVWQISVEISLYLSFLMKIYFYYSAYFLHMELRDCWGVSYTSVANGVAKRSVLIERPNVSTHLPEGGGGAQGFRYCYLADQTPHGPSYIDSSAYTFSLCLTIFTASITWCSGYVRSWSALCANVWRRRIGETLMKDKSCAQRSAEVGVYPDGKTEQ